MQISTFSHITIEIHKAVKCFDSLDIDKYSIVGVNRKESPDGKNTMIENYGLACYDNLEDAEITANNIADALGIDYIGVAD